MSLIVNPVLCRAGVMDNYAYVIIDKQSRECAVVDASEALPIIQKCQALNVKPRAILTTHHHFDHVGGNEELKRFFGLKVIGPQQEAMLIPAFDKGVKEGDIFILGESKAKIIVAPGHTKGHVLYYFEQDKVLFTGDVLFNLCIGGLFEGTKNEMKQSLEKIKALPDDVLFYPGHEYTMACLSDALALNPSAALKDYASIVQERLHQNLPAAPISLGLEKLSNPYLKD